jgi:hypothetical protein
LFSKQQGNASQALQHLNIFLDPIVLHCHGRSEVMEIKNQTFPVHLGKIWGKNP